jgi:hypothetical protein
VSSDVLVLKRMPVGRWCRCRPATAPCTTPLLLSDYELDADTGLVRTGVGRLVPYGTYTVTYTSGRADLPAAIRLAVLIIAEHLWETQRGAAPVGPLCDR